MPEQKFDKSQPEKLTEWKEELPLIPLRNMVVFPQMIVPLFIGRSKSVKALEETLAKEKMVVFAAQRNEEVEEPTPRDICAIGTLAEVVQMITLPDETITSQAIAAWRRKPAAPGKRPTVFLLLAQNR